MTLPLLDRTDLEQLDADLATAFVIAVRTVGSHWQAGASLPPDAHTVPRARKLRTAGLSLETLPPGTWKGRKGKTAQDRMPVEERPRVKNWHARRANMRPIESEVA